MNSNRPVIVRSTVVNDSFINLPNIRITRRILRFGSLQRCKSLQIPTLAAYILAIVAMPIFINSLVAQESENTLTRKSQENGVILVDDFDLGDTEGVFFKRKNSIGHYQGTWSKRPSYTLLTKSEIHRRGDTGKGLVINYKKESGWCGWYTILKEIDVSNFNVLSFWVKGDVGGERFDVGFTDAQRDRLEMDAVYAGPVTQFAGEISTEWTEVKIPLSRIGTTVDLSQLATVVFNCKYGGEGTFYIDDMNFKIDPDIEEIEEANLPKAGKSKWYPRSMWVWKVDPVTNEKARKDVIKVCKLTATEIIYLFFGDFNQHRDPQYTAMLKEFLEQCHEADLSVEILTGNPTWALLENHDKAYNWLKPFLDFNRTQPENARFDGVSFDVEPYLASEWKFDKQSVKKQYIILLRRLRKLVDSYPEQSFHFGCAIPTFYINEGDFEEEILMLSDYVALMDYYDTADDMIKNADKHLHLAKKLGKKIWIGSEIQDLVAMKQGFRSNTFFEEGWEYMESELDKVKEVFEKHPGFGGFAMHCYYAYRQMQKERTTPQNTLRLEKSLEELYTVHAYRQTKPVTIDGDLRDWNLNDPFTLDIKKHVVYGAGAWKGNEDLSCKTHAQWNDNTIYFAFEITDNQITQWKSGPDMWMGDHLELWLDADLGIDFIEAVNSNDDFQIGLSPGNFDDLKAGTHVWVPSIKQSNSSKINVASAKTDDGYVLEVSIHKDVLYNDDTTPMSITDVIEYGPESKGRKMRYTQKRKSSAPKNFREGYKLGIMIDASDTDDEDNPQKCLMSSSLDRRWGDPTVFGFLELKGMMPAGIQSRTEPPAEKLDGAVRPTETLDVATTTVDFNGLSIDSENLTEELQDDIGFLSIVDIPELSMASDTYIYELLAKEDESKSSRTYRGKLGAYQLDPDAASTTFDGVNFYDSRIDSISNYDEPYVVNEDQESTKLIYSKTDKDMFCGSYLLLMGDMSRYKTLTFLIKGANGGETFEIGLNDAVAHKREDAVFVGSINRYLENGITTDWQLVSIPLNDFYGCDLSKAFSLTFLYNEAGDGTFWVDEMAVTNKQIVDRNREIGKKGFLLFDNFDHSDLNLLGRKTSTYKKLPSYILPERVTTPRHGDSGRSLKLHYVKKNTGWTGYYTLLNQIDGEYYDLSRYRSVSFWIKGENGGEDFEIGLADKNWIIIGDSLKAGQITKYLRDGVTTSWQYVEIPLGDFGPLDLTEMGSFVLNFNVLNESVIYMDDLKFHLSNEYSMEEGE